MRKPKKNFKLSLREIVGNMAFSDEGVWAYYKIPGTEYEFMEDEARIALASRIDNALEALIERADRPIDCKLSVTSKPLNITAWRKQLDLRAEQLETAPGYNDWMDQMEQYLIQQGFQDKQVYLGVYLGDLHSSGDSSSVFGSLKDTFNKALGLEDYEISEKEMARWGKRAHHFNRILTQGNLQVELASPSDIARLTKQTLYPSMEVPPVTLEERERWGYGEVFNLSDSYIEVDKKFLRVTQTNSETGQDMVGYKATLAFARFPDKLYFPEQEPWIHYSSMLGWAVNFYSRFSIVPSGKVKKDVHKKLQEATDEYKNATGAGREAPLDVQEKVAAAQELEYSLNRNRRSWIYGYHRITVEAPTEDSLRDRAQEVIDHYRDLGIEIVWPSGDQFQLLLESQPADKIRVHAYQQRQDLSIISGGMPTATSAVGDRVERTPDGKERGWLGPYLGYSTSRIREAVFLSMHSTIARNSPGGMLITGSPGGGKSFTAFTLTCSMAMQGAWCIYLDPKADALPITGIGGLGQSNVFDLREGEEGLLDPFSLSVGEESQSALMAMEILRILLGDMNSDQESALISAVREVAEAPNPSLMKVVDLLSSRSDSVSKGMGGTLDMMSKLPFARLCFSSKESQSQLSPDMGLTVVTMLGLELPSDSQDPHQYTFGNRLAVAVMYLLTTFTFNLMNSLDRSHPKAIIIDEAWAVTSTPQGKAMIPKIARLGRSLNTALILVSQNAQDFIDDGLANSMSVRLAFKANSRSEREGVINLMGLEDSNESREIIGTLENGECLMQDRDGKTTRVQVDSWNENWRTAFDTNPETRGKEIAA